MNLNFTVIIPMAIGTITIKLKSIRAKNPSFLSPKIIPKQALNDTNSGVNGPLTIPSQIKSTHGGNLTTKELDFLEV